MGAIRVIFSIIAINVAITDIRQNFFRLSTILIRRSQPSSRRHSRQMFIFSLIVININTTLLTAIHRRCHHLFNGRYQCSHHWHLPSPFQWLPSESSLLSSLTLPSPFQWFPSILSSMSRSLPPYVKVDVTPSAIVNGCHQCHRHSHLPSSSSSSIAIINVSHADIRPRTIVFSMIVINVTCLLAISTTLAINVFSALVYNVQCTMYIYHFWNREHNIWHHFNDCYHSSHQCHHLYHCHHFIFILPFGNKSVYKIRNDFISKLQIFGYCLFYNWHVYI